MSDPVDERFRPTSGRVAGVMGVLIAVAVWGTWALHPEATPPDWALAGALVLAVVSWAAMLRPRISVAGPDLVLRNMLETVRVPLVLVDSVVVRQVLAVRVGERRFVSPAVGRRLRQMVKGNLRGAARPEPGPSGLPHVGTRGNVDYADFVEHRIQTLVKDARRRAPTHDTTPPPVVRRSPAWPEIAALAVALVALVATAVL